MNAMHYQFRAIAQECRQWHQWYQWHQWQWQWERVLPAIECAVGPVRGQGPLPRPVLAGPVEVMGLC
jgi:hypothetical protein